MTRKIYKSAMGKPVDIGALMLQNEQVRAVGNMNVNARGDLVDGRNQVIETRNKQAQRQYRRQTTNVSNTPVSKGTLAAKKPQQPDYQVVEDTFDDLLDDDVESNPTPPAADAMVSQSEPSPVRGGLAAAIARSREIKQELGKTPRQRAQEQPLKKI